MSSVRRLFDLMPKILEGMSTTLLFLIMVTVFLQVVFRYVLGLAVPWTEEAARYFNVWMVFMGCAVAVAREGHIRITFMIDRLRGPLRDAMLIALYAVMAGFEVIVFFGAIRLTQLNWNQQATTLPVTVSTLYIALIVSALLSFLFITVLFGRRLTALIGRRT